jgi:ABC-type enterochelin transport system ATPase subunit
MVFVIVLSGCQATCHFNLSYPEKEIDLVEIIEISSGIERVVKSLDAKSVAVIIDDLNKMKCYQYWNDPNQTIEGIAIKIIYANGDYDIITSSVHALYSNRHVSYGRKYFDKDSFNSMLDRYLD